MQLATATSALHHTDFRDNGLSYSTDDEHFNGFGTRRLGSSIAGGIFTVDAPVVVTV